DDDARHKRSTSPLQVFDVKTPSVRAALEGAPKIGESLCDECRAHFEEVRRLLDLYGVPYVLDPTLVRGLDYYSRTTFEFIGPDENANSTICGGGRYDGLIQAVGGPATPGIGFGAGLERLVLALENEGVVAQAPTIDVFFVVGEEAERDRVLAALAAVRRAGLAADTDYAGRSLKGQLTQGARSGAHSVVVVRGDEATIRRDGHDDRTVRLDEVVATLTSQ
nr:ATP phosphoribosyltransferase regulatory subunit [Actinomycetota bacterium]